MTKAAKPHAHDPSIFINRELSWLAFNERVLEEAADKSVPLLERIKFAAIAASNLDEFFMVRVAGLLRQAAAGIGVRSADGRTSQVVLSDTFIGKRISRPTAVSVKVGTSLTVTGFVHSTFTRTRVVSQQRVTQATSESAS